MLARTSTTKKNPFNNTIANKNAVLFVRVLCASSVRVGEKKIKISKSNLKVKRNMKYSQSQS